MSIERKIAEMLAQSKLNEGVTLAGKEGGMDPGTHGAVAGNPAVIRDASNNVPNGGETPNADNARNNVDDEDEAANATSKKSNPVTAKAEAGDQAVIRTGTSVKEDVDALLKKDMFLIC